MHITKDINLFSYVFHIYVKKDNSIRLSFLERVMGLEPTNGSLGSYCLTTWQHPHKALLIIATHEIDVKSGKFVVL
jgi:hypothetical protein